MELCIDLVTGMAEATHLEPNSDLIVLLQITSSRAKLGILPLLLNIVHIWPENDTFNQMPILAHFSSLILLSNNNDKNVTVM